MSERTVAVVQARMGSTRLPGKVLLPLDNSHVLSHIVQRISFTSEIDQVVVATSTETSDNIILNLGERVGVDVHRGSEANVQQRMYDAAVASDADYVVRITADCPLVDPSTIDAVASRVTDASDVDYVSNTINRTFPRGLDVEAFSLDSFETVVAKSSEERHHEHVTPFYHENPEQFVLENVTSEEVFRNDQFQNRSDLRLTLDEADDYEVLRQIYENVGYDDILPIQEAIRYVDENDLMEINASIEQKQI